MIRSGVLVFACILSFPLLGQSSVQGWKYQIELQQDDDGDILISYSQTDSRTEYLAVQPKPDEPFDHPDGRRLSVDVMGPTEFARRTPRMINDGRINVLNLALSRDAPEKKGYQMILSYVFFLNSSIQPDFRYPENSMVPLPYVSRFSFNPFRN